MDLDTVTWLVFFKDWTGFYGFQLGFWLLFERIGLVFLLDVGFCSFDRMLDFFIRFFSKIQKKKLTDTDFNSLVFQGLVF
jgi:hypothetical protein